MAGNIREVLFLLVVTVPVGGSLAGCAPRERGSLSEY